MKYRCSLVRIHDGVVKNDLLAASNSLIDQLLPILTWFISLRIAALTATSRQVSMMQAPRTDIDLQSSSDG